MRLLIIKVSALGDIIHSLPVLSYLRQADTSVQIDWVVDDAFQELLSGNPLIDNLITVAFKRWKKSPLSLTTLSEILSFRKKIRSRSYDFVFDLQGNLKSGLICWSARAGCKVGFSRENLQERFNSLFTTLQIPFSPTDQHASQRYLRVVSAPFALQPDGMEWPTEIATSPEDESSVAEMQSLQGGCPVVLFHVGTTWQTKLWHEVGWLQLGQELLSIYPVATILFSWGNSEERERCERLVSQLGKRARMLGKLSLKQFAAVLKRCDVAVGGDTGPIHLAAAVGTPTVSLYRSTNGSRNGPFGAQQAIVQSPMTCTTCMRKTCEWDRECRQSISVEMMLHAVVNILLVRGFDRLHGCL